MFFHDLNSGSLVFMWSLRDDPAKAAIRDNAQLQQREREFHDKLGVYYLELLDITSGNIRSKVLIDTGKGSFVPTGAFSTKDRLFVRDNQERILVFTLDGKLLGRVFGRGATTTPDGRYLLVYNNRGRVTVYDSSTLDQRDQLDFAEPVSLLSFGADPSVLTVITSDQTLYFIDLKNFHEPHAGKEISRIE